jgi:hypothetical protein
MEMFFHLSLILAISSYTAFGRWITIPSLNSKYFGRIVQNPSGLGMSEKRFPNYWNDGQTLHSKKNLRDFYTKIGKNDNRDIMEFLKETNPIYGDNLEDIKNEIILSKSTTSSNVKMLYTFIGDTKINVLCISVLNFGLQPKYHGIKSTDLERVKLMKKELITKKLFINAKLDEKDFDWVYVEKKIIVNGTNYGGGQLFKDLDSGHQ